MREGGGEADPASLARLRKVNARLERLSVDRASLVNAFGKFTDRQDFSRTWSSRDPEALNRVEAVERGYEKVVNSLVEIADLTAAEAVAQEKIEAVEAEAVGRWERLTRLGAIAKSRATLLADLSAARNRLQHGYGGLDPLSGNEIHDAVARLLNEAPALLGDLEPWLDDLWPAPEEEA